MLLDFSKITFEEMILEKMRDEKKNNNKNKRKRKKKRKRIRIIAMMIVNYQKKSNKFRREVCVCVCMSVCVCICLSVSLSICLCVSLCLFVPVLVCVFGLRSLHNNHTFFLHLMFSGTENQISSSPLDRRRQRGKGRYQNERTNIPPNDRQKDDTS